MGTLRRIGCSHWFLMSDATFSFVNGGSMHLSASTGIFFVKEFARKSQVIYYFFYFYINKLMTPKYGSASYNIQKNVLVFKTYKGSVFALSVSAFYII